jgi:hypothetical protein
LAYYIRRLFKKLGYNNSEIRKKVYEQKSEKVKDCLEVEYPNIKKQVKNVVTIEV